MSRKVETKDIEFKFKMDGDGEGPGEFTGYASIFGVEDSYGDIVEKGAFKKTLREKKQFPLLWSHDIQKPIGVIAGEEDDSGLRVDGQLNLDVQLAKELRSLMKQGAVRGLSIGYNAVKELVDRETDKRRLKEINLWEVSPCVFQACPNAEVDDVKSKEPGREPDSKSTLDVKPETIHLNLIDDMITRIKSYLKS